MDILGAPQCFEFVCVINTNSSTHQLANASLEFVSMILNKR